MRNKVLFDEVDEDSPLQSSTPHPLSSRRNYHSANIHSNGLHMEENAGHRDDRSHRPFLNYERLSGTPSRILLDSDLSVKTIASPTHLNITSINNKSNRWTSISSMIPCLSLFGNNSTMDNSTNNESIGLKNLSNSSGSSINVGSGAWIRLFDRDGSFNQCSGKVNIQKKIRRKDWRALYSVDWFHTLINAPTLRIGNIILMKDILLFYLFRYH